jgi:hypothetical protein
MPTVLDSVSVVDLVVDCGIGFLKSDIFLHTTGDNASFVTNLRATQPGDSRTISRSNVDILANPNDPDYYRIAQRSVTSERRDPKFVRSSNPV